MPAPRLGVVRVIAADAGQVGCCASPELPPAYPQRLGGRTNREADHVPMSNSAVRTVPQRTIANRQNGHLDDL